MSTEAETPNPIHDNNISSQQVITTNTPALANNANVLDISTMKETIKIDWKNILLSKENQKKNKKTNTQQKTNKTKHVHNS